MPLDSHVSSDVTSEPPERADAATGLDEADSARAPEAGAEPENSIAPVWLQRLSLLVLVLFCVYLGVLVMILPWWTRVWDHNALIESRPAVAAVLHRGSVRGLISGVGLLDIWIGISEAVHYRDHRP